MDMQVNIIDDTYELSFAYDPTLIEFCKALQRGRYDPRRQLWTAVRNMPNAIDLHKAGHFYDEDVLKFAPATREVGTGYSWGVQAHLYKHQVAWTRWVIERKKVLLSAEMGLGKSLMAMLAFNAHHVEPTDVVIICPSSLIYNWRDELRKFTAEEAIAVSDSYSTVQRLKLLETPGIHIVNYEFITLNAKARAMLDKKKVVVADESHKIKNPGSQRSKVLHKFCAGRDMVLLLTGTPISQGAQDYYSQFRAINPALLGSSFTAFKARYCLQEQIKGAPVGVRRITGYKNLDELNRIIAPYCYTILKKDCLDLPEKTYLKYYVDLAPDQRDFYRQIKSEMAAYIGPGGGTAVTASNILTRMLRLSQVTQGFVTVSKPDDPEVKDLYTFKENPKLKALDEIIDDIPEYESFVVICRFTQDIHNVKQLLMNKRISGCIIDGSVATEDRQDMVNKFQAGGVRALIGQIQVAGLGLNLTKASKLIFYSNDYSLVNRLQAEDRIHRIGQIGEQCVYIDIVARNTVDEHVIQALVNKTEVASQLTQLRQHFSS